MGRSGEPPSSGRSPLSKRAEEEELYRIARSSLLERGRLLLEHEELQQEIAALRREVARLRGETHVFEKIVATQEARIDDLTRQLEEARAAARRRPRIWCP